MNKVISTERIPIKLWLDDIEESALQQAKNLANLPFAFKHVALMPDSHFGFGMPIGGVLATKGVIIPNSVGVDIGCGMRFMETDIHISNLPTDKLKSIMGKIRKEIPMGFSKQNTPVTYHQVPILGDEDRMPIVWKNHNNTLISCGTLGGGNHFIEFQTNEKGFICVMIHSGSRNLGKQVADFYNKEAIKLNEKCFSQVPKEWELAFLPLGDVLADNYMSEMNYCVQFANYNRAYMMEAILNILHGEFGHCRRAEKDVAHNYATMENHFGQNVMVHRKGAIRARKGDLGIIPGSQGTSSYIVEGLGNVDSFNSCSHGAGRLMSRTKARNTLDLQIEQDKLDKQGIIHSIRDIANLDEASSAYKDIDVVMENQKDLVNITMKLTPIAVLKG